MKKPIFFVLILLCFSIFSYAQNKRIVVLEPIDKEQNIDPSIVMMVQSNFTKVISRMPGYEGYDGLDMAEFTKNLDFDSLVEEERIRLIGENAKADYILVSEMVKYKETSVFITAKIINGETAATEGFENATMTMTTQNIQYGCESLIRKLLILTNRYNKMVQLSNKDIGEIIVFPDGTKGIVFYLDENGRGLAVSLIEGHDVWDSNSNRKDIVSLYNVENGESVFKYGEGQRNTQIILSSLGNKARAAYWCSLLGEEWYLPSSGELFVLMRIADENSAFIEALGAAGGDRLDGWYWSSTEHDDDEAWNVNNRGRSSTEDKEKEIKVRAVRAFTIK